VAILHLVSGWSILDIQTAPWYIHF